MNELYNKDFKKYDEFMSVYTLYRPLIDSLSGRYFALAPSGSGLDFDDFRQEACIALYNAMLTYKSENNLSSFGYYSKVCIRNRFISMLKSCHSLNLIDDDDILNSQSLNTVEDDYIDKESVENIMKSAEKMLSEFEYTVLSMTYDEIKYFDIAKILNVNVKSVYNAMNRIKTKLRSGIDYMS